MISQRQHFDTILTVIDSLDLWDTDLATVTAIVNQLLAKSPISPVEQKTILTLLGLITKAVSIRKVSKDRIIESQIINELNLHIITTLDEKKIIQQIESAAQKMLATKQVLMFYLAEDNLIGTERTLSLEKIPAEFYYQIFNYRHIFTSDYPKHRFLNKVLKTKTQQVTFVPLTIKNEVHGFFLLFEDPQKFSWNTAITRLKFLVNQASIALERVQLIHELNRALNESQGLQTLTKMMMSTLELRSFFSSLLNQVQKILGFDRILLSLYDQRTETFNRVSQVGISADKYRKARDIHPPLSMINTLLQNRFRISNSFYIPVSKTPDTIHEYEVYKHPLKTKERIANFWHKGDILISPIYSKNRELLGYLSLDAPVNNLAPSLEKIKLLETFGDFLGLAIENNQLFAKVEGLSNTDELTGIYNYRFLRDRMADLVTRDASPFSIIMIDLDNFKQFNDKYGHLRGDRILREISGIFAVAVGKTGFVTRYGGDEFIILLPGAGARAARLTVQNIIRHLKKDTARNVTVDFSFGIATYPVDGRNFGELIDHADQIVYREKSKRRHEARP
ncbi:MAG TPA: diguanylate cyclase [bacterium]